MRIALMHHTYPADPDDAVGRLIHQVATALGDAGHYPCVVTSHVRATRRSSDRGLEVVRLRRLPEARLRQRGFTGPLTHLPSVVGELLSGDYHLAHAFSAPDALAAQVWRSVVDRPVVFMPAEPITRERLSDRRLRVPLLERAVERSDVVIAPSARVRTELWRWLAVEAVAVDPDDASGQVQAYREAMQRRTGSNALK